MSAEIKNYKIILLVDDDPHDVELTLNALSEYHLANRIAVACDGAEALDYLFYRGKYKMRVEGDPAVVLLDNKMPKVTGLELLKIMKADARLKLIPVVVLTSSREKRDKVDFYKHHASAYVVKPLDFVDFFQAVRHIGLFWGKINEPPPPSEKEELLVQDLQVSSDTTEDVRHEISADHTHPYVQETSGGNSIVSIHKQTKGGSHGP